MRRTLEIVAVFALCLMLPVAYGQAATVSAQANYSWTLPTLAQPGNVPLTGVNALTKVQAWVSTSAIADAPTTPAIDLTATATGYSYTSVVPNGSTLYGRFRACSAAACSALSAQVGKPILILIPDMPTGVGVVVTVTVTTP